MEDAVIGGGSDKGSIMSVVDSCGTVSFSSLSSFSSVGYYSKPYHT